MQVQADLIDRPVVTADVEEIGALGVAGMAMAAMGVALTPAAGGACYAPALPAAARDAARRHWAAAIRQAQG